MLNIKVFCVYVLTRDLWTHSCF